jgi:hypothetical protein
MTFPSFVEKQYGLQLLRKGSFAVGMKLDIKVALFGRI